MVNGENFLMERNGVKNHMGFFVTRIVEADNENDAEEKAFDMLRKDPDLAETLNSPQDPPRMQIEQVLELDSNQEVTEPDIGFAFYVEEKEYDA